MGKKTHKARGFSCYIVPHQDLQGSRETGGKGGLEPVYLPDSVPLFSSVRMAYAELSIVSVRQPATGRPHLLKTSIKHFPRADCANKAML